MVNVTTGTVLPSVFVDAIFRAVVSNDVGVSTGGYGTIFHLGASATEQEQTDVQTLITNYDGLTVLSTVTTMTEGDTDPVITVVSGIGVTEELGYVVLFDGAEYDAGDVTAVASEATLNLVDPVEGVYEIFIYRKTDDFKSGRVSITVEAA